MIDRESEMVEFRRFLDPASPDWLLVFHGQNGLGKTTLLAKLAAGLEAGFSAACLDFLKVSAMQWSCEAVLDELNLSLRRLGLPDSAWQAYHEAQAELDRRSAEKQVVVNQSNDARNGSHILNSPQTVNVYLAAELRNIEREIQLERASAWLNLAEQCKGRLVVFIDHWDVLVLKGEPTFRRWFLESLLYEASRRLMSFRTVLTCDTPFVETGFESGVRQVVLSPLGAEHALRLLEEEGVDSVTVRDFLLKRLGGNPLLLKLAGAVYREHPGSDLSGLNRGLDVAAASKWLLERMQDSFPDLASKHAFARGVILDYFNLEMIQALCELENLDDAWFHTFSARPFLVDSPNRSGYKEFVRTVREIQIAYLWTQRSREFETLHALALKWYRRERTDMIDEPTGI